MTQNRMKNFDIKPLQTLIEENVEPRYLASLLDEFMFNHISTVLRLQYYSKEDGIPQNTEEILFFVKMLRDSLWECEK